MKTAIIGTGITGLSAAYYLTKDKTKNNIVHLFDRRDRIGGVLETIEKSNCQIEQSADNFITTVPWAVELCKELGLEKELVQTNPKARRTYVVRKNKLHLLPDGFLMMAPTRLLPLALTPLLSPFGKLRAALEYIIPPRKDDVDESMANFVRRRLGKEVFERMVEPLVSGIYASDMEKLSVLATLPRFREMERKEYSLIRAMQKQLKANRAIHLEEQSGARYSMFVTLSSGLTSLCKSLESNLPPDSVFLNCDVKKITKNSAGKWNVITDNTENNSTEYDNVVIAVSAAEASRLLTEILPELSAQLQKIYYEDSVVVTFAFRKAQIRIPLLGMGFVVPKTEGNPVLAGSFSKLKYSYRAPEDIELLRVFSGGARLPDAASIPDEKLIPLLFNGIKDILKIEGEPLWTQTAHWSKAMPQYYVGHRELITEIESLAAKEPTIALAGNYFNGVGIPNCIHSGQQTAEKFCPAT
ncbi:protoporphyrinogen oxidase [Planctomycetales bacterium]|nr:protoporphyrinogen oxidase [Planctomycetales bacterium]